MPYVGITGFTDPTQVGRALTSVPKETDRLLMVGVLATWKSLRGIPLKEKWQKQTPDSKKIENIFWYGELHPVLNLVHYSTEPGNEASLTEDLHKLIDLGGLRGIHGFQLNIPWPDIRLLEDFRRHGEGRRGLILDLPWIVLQISQRAVDLAGGTPQGVVVKLKDYLPIVDGILFDASGGLGKPLDAERARTFLSAIAEKGWELELGTAGGLGPDTLPLVEPLVEQFPGLNIDAQGRLRDNKNNLDPEAVRKYLIGAFRLFNGR